MSERPGKFLKLDQTIKHSGGPKPTMTDIKTALKTAFTYFGTIRGLLSLSKPELRKQLRDRGIMVHFKDGRVVINKYDINGKKTDSVSLKRDDKGKPTKTAVDQDGKISGVKTTQLKSRLETEADLRKRMRERRQQRQPRRRQRPGMVEAGVQTRRTIRPGRGRPRKEQGV